MAAERDNLTRIRSLLKFHPRGLTISDISHRLSINRNSVAKYLEILEISGFVEYRQMGAAKVFHLSRRVPLTSILEYTKEGFVVVNQETRIIQVNDRFCRMFELNQRDLLGAPVSALPAFISQALSHPGIPDDQEIGPGDEQILRTSQYDWSQYFRLRILSTIFDTGEQGKTIIIEDITLEKEMEDRLRIHEARYRGIVEDQTEMICRYTPDWRLTFVNEVFCRMFRIPQGEMHLHTLREFLAPDIAQKVREEMDTCTPGSPVWERDIEIIAPSGSRQWQHWTFRGIFDNSGEVMEFQGVGRDVSEKKQEEMELLVTSSAIRSSILPIGLATLEGIITYVNPSFLKMWGYDGEDEIIGMPVEHLAHGSVEALKSIFLIRQAVLKHATFSGEIPSVRRDGTPFHLLIWVSVVRDREGSPLCLIMQCSDITSQVMITRDVRMKDSAMTSAFEGVAIISPDGTLRYTNPSFSRIFRKITRKILCGTDSRIIFDSYPQLACRREEIAEAVERGEDWKSIITDISDDGKTTIIQVHISGARDTEGTLLCTILSALDITGQRMAEESLAMMYLHLEEAIEHVGNPTFIIDNEHRIVAWNRAMVTLTGYPRDEVIGTDRYHEACSRFEPAVPVLADLVDIPVRDLIRRYPRVSRFCSGLFTESCFASPQGGRETHIWAKASPIRNGAGQTIGVIQTMKDMTNWQKITEPIAHHRDTIPKTGETGRF